MLERIFKSKEKPKNISLNGEPVDVQARGILETKDNELVSSGPSIPLFFGHSVEDLIKEENRELFLQVCETILKGKDNNLKNNLFDLLDQKDIAPFLINYIIQNSSLAVFLLLIKHEKFQNEEVIVRVRTTVILFGRLDLLKVFKENEVFKKDDRGLQRGDLFRAAKHNQLPVLKWLFAEAKFPDRDLIQKTLKIAIYCNHLPIVKYVANNYCSRKDDSYGENEQRNELIQALCLAAKQGNLDIFKFLFTFAKKILTKKTFNHLQKDPDFLIKIVDCNSIEILKFLLANGHYHLSFSDRRGPVLVAAEAGHIVLLDYLISNGANLYEKDAFGNTAAHYAAKGGQIKVLKSLQEKGFDLETPNKDGERPLLYAIGQKYIAYGHDVLPTLQFLVSTGCQLDDEAADTSNSLLCRAVFHNNLSVIEWLIALLSLKLSLDEKSAGYLNARGHLTEETLALILPHLVGQYKSLVQFFEKYKDTIIKSNRRIAEDFCQRIIFEQVEKREDYENLLDIYYKLNPEAARDFRFQLFIDEHNFEGAQAMCQEILENEAKKQHHEWAKYKLAYYLFLGGFSLNEKDSPLNAKESFLTDEDSKFKRYLEAFHALANLQDNDLKTILNKELSGFKKGDEITCSPKTWGGEPFYYYQAYDRYKTSPPNETQLALIERSLIEIKSKKEKDLEKGEKEYSAFANHPSILFSKPPVLSSADIKDAEKTFGFEQN